MDNSASPTTQATSRITQLLDRHAAGAPSDALHYQVFLHFTAYDHCTRGWWRTTLLTSSTELSAQTPSFTSHIESLRNAQKRMHLLDRKCTRARLYPNPVSANTKYALQGQLSALEADMKIFVKRHDTYAAALDMYTFPVRAVIDSLNTSGKECPCSDCTRQLEQSAIDTHAEIRLEAEALARKLSDIDKTFKKLHKDILKKWEKTGRSTLRRTIDALPDQEELRSKAVVRKYFPRQVREIEEAENRTVRGSAGLGTPGGGQAAIKE